MKPKYWITAAIVAAGLATAAAAALVPKEPEPKILKAPVTATLHVMGVGPVTRFEDPENRGVICYAVRAGYLSCLKR